MAIYKGAFIMPDFEIMNASLAYKTRKKEKNGSWFLSNINIFYL